MDPRLLRYYNQELAHLREMGAEFAARFEKIAGRLRMNSLEVADPYVERLLEGFAFLTARVQLRIDAEFPRFTQRLLEVLYPNFLTPTPAMLIAQFQPDLREASLARGVTIARGSMLRADAGRASDTACRFRTAHDLTLWPLEITEAAYFSFASQLPLAGVPAWRNYQGGLRLKLRATGGLNFAQIDLRDLRLHFTGADETCWRLHELVCGHMLGVLVRGVGAGAGNGAAERLQTLPAEAVQAVSYARDQALLPLPWPGMDGWRLLQEYFAFAHRFLFFDLCGLGDALRALGGNEAEVVLLFAQGQPDLERTVSADNLALHCVPAVNAFEHRCDRIHVGVQGHDLQVVPDRTRPMDFEVLTIQEVTGYGAGAHDGMRFLPFYAAFHTEPRDHNAYFAQQREPRLMSTIQQRDGPRSSYIGSEVFLSIVDSGEAPYPAALQQLGVTALCSNRDLPTLLGVQAPLTLEGTAPLLGIRVLKGPSKPRPALREAQSAWRLISQLSLNHLSLLDTDAEQGAAALRELLKLHVHEADAALLKQVGGVRSVRTEAVVRRLPPFALRGDAGPGDDGRSAEDRLRDKRREFARLAFGRGVRIDVEVDELAFQGGSAFLLGSVLEQFFARHVSMNGFTETHLHSPSRGEILSGLPRVGSRPVF